LESEWLDVVWQASILQSRYESILESRAYINAVWQLQRPSLVVKKIIISFRRVEG
jgi:hypothetical protein